MPNWVKAAQTSYYLASLPEQERVDVEFVTDTVLQVLIYMHTRGQGCAGGPWLMCQAIDEIARALDDEGCETFASFIVAFNAAWQLWDARSRIRRLRLLRER